MEITDGGDLGGPVLPDVLSGYGWSPTAPEVKPDEDEQQEPKQATKSIVGYTVFFSDGTAKAVFVDKRVFDGRYIVRKGNYPIRPENSREEWREHEVRWRTP